MAAPELGGHNQYSCSCISTNGAHSAGTQNKHWQKMEGLKRVVIVNGVMIEIPFPHLWTTHPRCLWSISRTVWQDGVTWYIASEIPKPLQQVTSKGMVLWSSLTYMRDASYLLLWGSSEPMKTGAYIIHLHFLDSFRLLLKKTWNVLYLAWCG